MTTIAGHLRAFPHTLLLALSDHYAVSLCPPHPSAHSHHHRIVCMSLSASWRLFGVACPRACAFAVPSTHHRVQHWDGDTCSMMAGTNCDHLLESRHYVNTYHHRLRVGVCEEGFPNLARELIHPRTLFAEPCALSLSGPRCGLDAESLALTADSVRKSFV